MNDQTIILPFDVQLPPVTALRAGDLSCLYESGNLRAIRVSHVEIIRMIYAAVRDQHWATAPYQITNEKIETTSHAFSVSYTAFYELNEIKYKADFEITGNADSTITFRMRGEALSDFKRNRIGFCVLHPINECAGRKAEISTADDTFYNAFFPTHISPRQPFLDVQQLAYTIENMEVQLRFEGDVFETEDQRNWTDSSFKTYSTPQRLPLPVEVKKGETIAQCITLRVVVNPDAIQHETADCDETQEQKVPVPKIGFSRVPGSPLLNEQQIGLLKKLPFHHYRITLNLTDATWVEELQHGAAEAQQLDALLELVLFFSAAYTNEVVHLIDALKKVNAQLFSILILQGGEKATPPVLMQTLYPMLTETFSNAHIGWGTDGNFADLNRNRPDKTLHDFVSFSMYPQVHASDMRSIMENLETQHHTLETAHTFTQQPIYISPMTFTGRHVKTSDARQQTAFAAWWTLKTLHNLSRAHSITFYEITGPNGLLQPDGNTTGVKPTPVYDVFAQLKEFAPAWVIQNIGAHGLLDAVIFENKEGTRLRFVVENMGF